MTALNQDLEALRQLNDLRHRVKKLREQALFPLKAIKKIDEAETTRSITWKEVKLDQEEINFSEHDKWVASKDRIEAALLVKVQNHRDISENESENDSASAETDLKTYLTGITLKELIQPAGSNDKSITIPVLVAARSMQALVGRAETVFAPATMRCYYRIIRELYGVAQPNWTVGAARAGFGGTTSAFVTNECIRAVFAFQNALERTHKFFEHTSILFENFTRLQKMLRAWGIDKDEHKDHPLCIWANKTIEAMWLDCYLTTNPRSREMALFIADDGDNENKNGNALLLPDNGKIANLESADKYFDLLPDRLEKALDTLFQDLALVYREISDVRNEESETNKIDPIKGEITSFEFIEKAKERNEEKINRFNRTATAHLFAEEAITNAVFSAENLRDIVRKYKAENTSDGSMRIGYARGELLRQLSKEFYQITRRVSRVLEPSKQYLKWVINRELAASDANFDAGELVFAATSYGAINDWRLDERLNRACEKLIHSLSDNGRLPSKRPFHADTHGYRIVPIGCEMTRALSNLLQKTGYDFDVELVNKMLKMFEETSIELRESTAKFKFIAWNFEGAPEPDKPAVWVTAISVLALDRIVRMLNTRTNEIVLKHFDVIKPERPHTVNLRNLIYSDYGLVEWHLKDEEHADGKSKLTAINLQKMRAHIMRATLPEIYQKDKKSFSAIFYGPPGTGKTTLAESLALSSGVPFVKLSPSDLILQGQELLEGRARDVFEALSMLTQCVIIFDEFEPVLKNRKKEKPLTSNVEEGSSTFDTMQMSVALQKISQRDDPKFRFVLSGMLPKFGKLHDVAEKQSLTYCLGTNYLNDIDEAAKRPGRFDKQLPVYKPDTLSRAGTLLYRLSQLEEMINQLDTSQLEERKIDDEKYELGGNDKEQQIRRFCEVIALTVNQTAEQISRLSFELKKKDTGKLIFSKYLEYVFNPNIKLPLKDLINDATPSSKTEVSLKKKIQSVANDSLNELADNLGNADNIEPKEEVERNFLIESERVFEKNVLNPKNALNVEILGDYLRAEESSLKVAKDYKTKREKQIKKPKEGRK